MLKDLYIVLTDSAGNSALEVCVPVDSDDFRLLASETYPLQRLRDEAIMGLEVGGEIDGHRKHKLRKKYGKE